MRGRSIFLRLAAFCVLLIFSQKTGTGLLLHNLLHNNVSDRSLPDSQDNNKELSFACNCIDDFLMPFDGAEEIVIPAPVVVYETPVHFFADGPVFIIPSRPSLRGPPSRLL